MPTRTRKPKPRVWEEAWLEAYSSVPNIANACRLVGIAQSTFYDARHKDNRFAILVDEARRAAIGKLAEVAHRVAAEDEDPQMIRWLLARLAPEEYGDRSAVEVSGTMQVESTIHHPTKEQLREIMEIREAIGDMTPEDAE